jgi:hypothetical protein
MEEARRPLRRETAKALFAALLAAVVLAPAFWFIGVLHFGAITGPDPTASRMFSYTIWTSALGVLVFAFLLHRYVRAPRKLRFGRACLVAAAALAPVQAATSAVTLAQWGGDELVAVCALVLALLAVVFLTRSLSEPMAESRQTFSQTV